MDILVYSKEKSIVKFCECFNYRVSICIKYTHTNAHTEKWYSLFASFLSLTHILIHTYRCVYIYYTYLCTKRAKGKEFLINILNLYKRKTKTKTKTKKEKQTSLLSWPLSLMIIPPSIIIYHALIYSNEHFIIEATKWVCMHAIVCMGVNSLYGRKYCSILSECVCEVVCVLK